MTRRSRIALWVGGAVVVCCVIAAGIVGWIIKVRRAIAPPAPGLYIQARFRNVRESPGHAAHVSLPGLSCLSCHEETPGGLSRPTALVCVRCHEHAPPAIHPQAWAGAADAEHASWDHPPGCQGCHRFTQDRDYGPRDCMRCHLLRHAAVPAIVQHAATTCTLCHHPHRAPSLETTTCLACHGRHATAHGEVPSPEGCLTCHRVHDSPQAVTRRCTECHATRARD